jgi:hypothetical protein
MEETVPPPEVEAKIPPVDVEERLTVVLLETFTGLPLASSA